MIRSIRLPAAVDRLDNAVDQLLEPVRDNSRMNVIMNRASAAGDWSKVWHVIGIVSAVRRRRPSDAVVLSVLLGLESLIVNQGVKRLFRRDRPTSSGDHRSQVRTPSTSSFPSGHASAAAFALTVVSRRSGPKVAWTLAPAGLLVAYSRVHVRLHHLSDIVAGAAMGHILGRLFTAPRLTRR